MDNNPLEVVGTGAKTDRKEGGTMSVVRDETSGTSEVGLALGRADEKSRLPEAAKLIPWPSKELVVFAGTAGASVSLMVEVLLKNTVGDDAFPDTDADSTGLG